MLRARLWLLVAIGLGTLTGCYGSSERDDDDDGGSSLPSDGGIDTGLDEGSTIGSLSDEEYAQLCDALLDYTLDRFYGSAQESLCKWQALTVAGFDAPASDQDLQQACQEFYDTCLGLPPPDEAMAPGVETCPPRPASCSATVAEYEACYSEFQQAFEQALASLPACFQVTLADLPIQLPTPALSPSCSRVAEKCPGG